MLKPIPILSAKPCDVQHPSPCHTDMGGRLSPATGITGITGFTRFGLRPYFISGETYFNFSYPPFLDISQKMCIIDISGAGWTYSIYAQLVLTLT